MKHIDPWQHVVKSLRNMGKMDRDLLDTKWENMLY